jgi:hypothetical protein
MYLVAAKDPATLVWHFYTGKAGPKFSQPVAPGGFRLHELRRSRAEGAHPFAHDWTALLRLLLNPTANDDGRSPRDRLAVEAIPFA